MTTLKKNDEVEVCSEEEGLEGAWFRAILEENPTKSGRKKLRVRYLTLLHPNDSSPLIELSLQKFIRPIPPQDKYNDIVLKEGVKVDADHKDGWWTGVVIKEMEQDKFLVYFKEPPDLIQFDRKQLRPHIHWNAWNWVRPRTEVLLKSTFCRGAMVEVSHVIHEEETKWSPAMIVTEVEEEEEDKKMFVVKYCDKDFNFIGADASSNKTVDASRVRPTPPSSLVKAYKLLDSVEVFRGSSWRKGSVRSILSQNCYLVSLGTTMKEAVFKLAELRPLMEWEDGKWRKGQQQLVKQTPSNSSGKKSMRSCSSGVKPTTTKTATMSMKRSSNIGENVETLTKAETKVAAEESRKKVAASVTSDDSPLLKTLRVKTIAKKSVSSGKKRLVTETRAKTSPFVVIPQAKTIAKKSVSSVTLSPVVKQPVAVTGGKISLEKTLEQVRNQNVMETDLTQQKMPEEENSKEKSKKRKRNLNEIGGADTNNTSKSIFTNGDSDVDDQPLSTFIAKICVSSVTPSPIMKQPVTKAGGKTSPDETLGQEGIQNVYKTDSTQQKLPEEENSKRRKQDPNENGEAEINITSKSICNNGGGDVDVDDQPLSTLIDHTPSVVKNSAAISRVDETQAEDTVMSFPFVKKSPYWKTCASMESFKLPHFRSLCEAEEDYREYSALGMTVTFYSLLDEVKDLKLNDSPSKLNSLIVSFAELEKHGFDVEAPQLRIRKLLSLQDARTKKKEEMKCFGNKIEEGESETLKAEEELAELKLKFLELQRQEALAKEKKEKADKNLVEMKSSLETIGQKVGEVELEFQETVLAPW